MKGTRGKWMVAAKRADFYSIGRKFSIDPVTARLIRNRDVIGDDAIRRYLYGTEKDLIDPAQMYGIPQAVSLLAEALDGRKIRIIGDYDIDGVMSSCILFRGLKGLGADADVRIPERIKDGYGLDGRLIREAKADGRDVLVTCDNGIAAAAEIAEAKAMGLTVIVTDHHEVPFSGPAENRVEILPPADVVIDPKQSACLYPFKGLCGAGIVWKLMQALYSHLNRKLPEDLMEYAAFATVGDVVELKDENRILVREGLKRMRHTHNPGLAELISQNELDPEQLNTYHIGFVLGPCLNASGRLDTAMRALRMMCTDDRSEAARLAGDLIGLNASRKEMTFRNTEEARELVETSELARDKILVVYLPDCHESLAGIVAGRLRELFDRPAFVLTNSADGVKGSGRSVDAYDMYAGLNGCKDLLLKFGGHHMAAGLTLPPENVEPFRRRINESCALTEEELVPKTVIDVPMPVSYVTKSLVEELSILEPFGMGNEKPVFAEKNVQVLYPRVFGKNRNVIRMRVCGEGGVRRDALCFEDGDEFLAYVRTHPRISILYYPVIDRFRGEETLQIRILGYR